MPAGRPTEFELNPDIQKRICDAIRIGATRNFAAEYAGVCEKTFYNWIKKGKEAKKGKYKKFLQALKKAEAEGVVNNLSRIQNAGIGKIKDDTGEWTKYEGQWQALAWILERRHPKEYGKQVSLTDDTSKQIADAIENLKVKD